MRKGCWLSLLLGSIFVAGCMAQVGPETAELPELPLADQVERPPDDREPCNSFDDDGDGEVDEGCSCVAGQTQPCFPGPVSQAQGGGPGVLGLCSMGTQSCVAATDTEFGGVWGSCSGAVLPRPEICGDGLDQDCDGADVPCPNQAPIAGDDQASAVGEATVVIDVLANDSDAEGSGLTVVETSQGAKGGTVTITENGKKIAYALNAAFVEADSFTYKVSDGTTTTQATVQVAVVPDCRFHLNWPHFYWGVMAEESTIVGAVWNQQPGQGAVCGDAVSTSCSAGGYLYLKGRDLGDALGRGRTEICRKKL